MTSFVGATFRGGSASNASSRINDPRPEGLLALVATLLLRATANGCFLLWILAKTPGWSDVFLGGAVLALVDGGLGMLMGGLIVRHSSLRVAPVLLSMIFVDAVLRLIAGVGIHFFPGIADLPITVVLLFGVLGAWAATAGVLAMAAWIVSLEPKRNAVSPAHALFDPLAWAGVAALLMALYALMVGPPASGKELRTAAATVSAALAAILVVSAAGVARFAVSSGQVSGSTERRTSENRPWTATSSAPPSTGRSDSARRARASRIRR